MKIVINGSYGGFSLSNKALNLLKEKYGDKELDFYELSRHDKYLVEVIEELGTDVNSDYSELLIVEIPDGLRYFIHEYDGLESVEPYIEVTLEELKNGLSQEKLELLKFTDRLVLVQ